MGLKYNEFKGGQVINTSLSDFERDVRRPVWLGDSFALGAYFNVKVVALNRNYDLITVAVREICGMEGDDE